MLKDKILIGSTEVGLSGKMVSITKDSKIIYEYDQEIVDDNDPDDAAEIKMNEKRLAKSLSELNIEHQSVLQVQGLAKSETAEQQESSILLQLFENKEMQDLFSVNLIKKGAAPKLAPAAKPIPAPKKQTEETKVDISSDECEETEKDYTSKPKLLKKRKAGDADEQNAKRQKV